MQPSPVARVGEYPEFSAFFTWDGRALESPTVAPRCGPFETITLRENLTSIYGLDKTLMQERIDLPSRPEFREIPS